MRGLNDSLSDMIIEYLVPCLGERNKIRKIGCFLSYNAFFAAAFFRNLYAPEPDKGSSFCILLGRSVTIFMLAQSDRFLTPVQEIQELIPLLCCVQLHMVLMSTTLIRSLRTNNS